MFSIESLLLEIMYNYVLDGYGLDGYELDTYGILCIRWLSYSLCNLFYIFLLFSCTFTLIK